MTFTMKGNQSQRFGLVPVLADGVTPSQATLSNVSFTSSNPTDLVVTPDTDPTNPGGCICGGQGNEDVGVVVTAQATATEPDGTTTEVIVGAITIILTPVAPPPPPPPSVAAALVFVPLGAPTP